MSQSHRFSEGQDEEAVAQKIEDRQQYQQNSSSKKKKKANSEQMTQQQRINAYQVEYSNDVSKSQKPNEEDQQFKCMEDIENQNNIQNNEEQLYGHENIIPNNQNNGNFQVYNPNEANEKYVRNKNVSNIPQDAIQTTKNNYSTEQLKHPPLTQQLNEIKNTSPENHPIQISKLAGIDFTDPKNRQILEDQFFNNGENNLQNDEFDKQQEDKEVSIPHKFQYLSLFLAIAGLILIIVGFIVAFTGSSTNLMKGGAFWTIGALCCIPGIYYTFKIFRTKIATNQNDRLQAAEDIPRY